MIYAPDNIKLLLLLLLIAGVAALAVLLWHVSSTSDSGGDPMVELFLTEFLRSDHEVIPTLMIASGCEDDGPLLARICKRYTGRNTPSFGRGGHLLLDARKLLTAAPLVSTFPIRRELRLRGMTDNQIEKRLMNTIRRYESDPSNPYHVQKPKRHFNTGFKGHRWSTKFSLRTPGPLS